MMPDGAQTVDPSRGRPIDVAALAREIAESMKPLAPGLRVETPGAEVLVVGETGELREAIVNVVENAVKYGAGSPIDMRVATAGDLAILEIADAGPGMRAQDRERVFERFYRGSTHSRAEGTGLGLAIAKRAVERANGQITLASEPGRGTTVKFYLPLVTTSWRHQHEPHSE
jgi:signal transduction histidine kinase